MNMIQAKKKDNVNTFQNIVRTGGFQNSDGFHIRDDFSHFFIQEGAVDWQDNKISKVK